MQNVKKNIQEDGAPSVWVVIVTYDSFSDTADCLESLKAASWENLRVVLVDNGSGDGSGERLRAQFPEIVHIRSASNLGFAGGCNLGISTALEGGADYICLLNNDTVVEPGFIEPLVEAAMSVGGAGIIGGKIFYDGPGYVLWYAGGRIDRRTGLTSHRGQDAADAPVFSRPMFTDYVTGCLFFMPAVLYRKLGLLEEGFFMYAEELEFCLRARRAGYLCYYEPRSVIRHRVSRSMGKAYRPLFYYYQTRNLLESYRRHAVGLADGIGGGGPEGGRLAAPVRQVLRHLVAGQSLTMVRAHRSRAIPYIGAIWLGFLDYLRGRSGPCLYRWLDPPRQDGRQQREPAR